MITMTTTKIKTMTMIMIMTMTLTMTMTMMQHSILLMITTQSVTSQRITMTQLKLLSKS